MISRRQLMQTGVAAAGLAAIGLPARAGDTPGVTATEIRIGQTCPYSGPASSYGVVGKVEAAYFNMINEQGGVNGRKINFISLDDAYSPPKTVAQVRRLVESDQVAALFNMLGTAPNLAVRQYLNDNKIPQLFVSTGASVFSDPEHYPWTIGYNPNYKTEARICARYILKDLPDARIAVLYQNDDFGKDYLEGLKEGLGADHAGMIVKAVSYETSEPAIDSQIVTLQGSGANVLLIAATPKFAAQAIRKSYDLGWDATRILSNVSASIATTLKPAGLDKSKGVIASYFGKDPTDALWKDDEGLKYWKSFCAKYFSDKEFIDANAAYAIGAAATLVQVLKQCGDDLSRENIMKQAANIHDLELPMLLPGIKLNTSAGNYSPIRQMQLARFDGESWKLFGDIVSG